MASGLINTSRLIGGALGLTVLRTLAAAHTQPLQGAGGVSLSALSSGYALAFGLGAGRWLLGALAAGVLLRVPVVRASAAAGAAQVGS